MLTVPMPVAAANVPSLPACGHLLPPLLHPPLFLTPTAAATDGPLLFKSISIFIDPYRRRGARLRPSVGAAPGPGPMTTDRPRALLSSSLAHARAGSHRYERTPLSDNPHRDSRVLARGRPGRIRTVFSHGNDEMSFYLVYYY